MRASASARGARPGRAVLLAGCRSPADAGPARRSRPGRPGSRWPCRRRPARRAGCCCATRRPARAGGSWWAAVADAAGGTRPAAWTSTDAVDLDGAAVRCRAACYGEQNVLYRGGLPGRPAGRGRRARAVGCTAIRGSVPGGRSPTASLVEVPAAFEVYGGPDAVNVAPDRGRPARLADRRQPGQRGGGLGVRRRGGVRAGRGGAGAGQRRGGPDRGRTTRWRRRRGGWWWARCCRRGGSTVDPAVWTSPDGRAWRRAALPAAGRRGPAAGGRWSGGARGGGRAARGDGFGAWLAGAASGWRAGGGFGGGGPEPAGPGVGAGCGRRRRVRGDRRAG